MTTGPAKRLRRPAESRAVRSRTSGSSSSVYWGFGGRLDPDGSLQQVYRREQGDPHHVDELPVVRHYDGGDGLRVGEPAGEVGAPEDVQERDQPAGDVETVEAGRQGEAGAVRRGGHRQ